MSKSDNKPPSPICLYRGRWISLPFVTITDRHCFVDRIRFWLKAPPETEFLDKIRDHCRGGARVFDRKKLDGGWTHKVELYQPTSGAFELLVKLKETEILINYLELALDVISAKPHEPVILQDFVTAHLFQPCHGDQKYNNFRGTEYSGSRSARNQYVAYSSRPSKITGEVNCTHLEWRIKEVSAVRAHGIHTFKDLVNFDHMAFWEKNLRLYWIPSEKLGRLELNQRGRTQRRASPVVDYGHGIKVSPDARLGHLLKLEACTDEDGYVVRDPASTQLLIDKYGVIARKARIPITIDWILKKEGPSTGLQA